MGSGASREPLRVRSSSAPDVSSTLSPAASGSISRQQQQSRKDAEHKRALSSGNSKSAPESIGLDRSTKMKGKQQQQKPAGPPAQCARKENGAMGEVDGIVEDLRAACVRARPDDALLFAAEHLAKRLISRGAGVPESLGGALSEARAAQRGGPPRPAAVLSRMGGRSKACEDAYCVVEDVAARAEAELGLANLPAGVRFYAVFDGHGGVQASSFACRDLWKKLAASPAFAEARYAAALEDAFRDEEAELAAYLAGCGGTASGTCACAAVIAGDTAYIANLGDARCVLASGGGRLDVSFEQLSTDHKATEPGERARLEEVGALVFEGRLLGVLAVSRSLGDCDFKKAASDMTQAGKQAILATPEIREHPLQDTDRYLVLATDGVWDALASDAAAKLVLRTAMRTKSTRQAAEQLAETACKTSFDDITVIVVPLNVDGVVS